MTAAGVPVEFARARLPDDLDLLTDFLGGDEWPFHGPTPSRTEIGEMLCSNADVESHWMIEDGRRVGLIRLLDLADIGEGAPLFDLRIASADRGRGLGTLATNWLVGHLFGTYPGLHRIEATTRADNLAMRSVLTRCGFTQEGRLRQAWPAGDGSWFDTLVFGILRSDVVDRV